MPYIKPLSRCSDATVPDKTKPLDHQCADACPSGEIYNSATSICEPVILPEKNLGEPQQCIANPCNPATGNKYQSEVDYRDPVGAFSFTRSYNSGANKDLGLGFGWSTNATPYLEINSATLTVWRGDGRGERFTKNASGAWQGDADSEFILAQDATGYTLTLADGAHERYTLAGKLVSSTNRAGLTYTYDYNAQGKLAALTGPFGHALIFGYDTNGHLATLTDPAGKGYSYTYDANNNLIRVTYPDGKFKTYHYENATFPHHLTGISDENGNRYATWSYDSQGRAVTSQHAVTDNADPQEKYTLQYDTDTQTTITDAIGNKEVMTFAVTLGMKNLTARKNLSDNKTHTQTFDAHNNLTCKQDAEGRVTTYTYNAANQRVSMTEGLTGACGSPVSGAATRTVTYQYLSAELDLPTLIESPSVWATGKKQTRLIYDAQRNPIEITQSGYTPAGAPISRSVKLGYNASGQVIQLDGPRTNVNDLTTLTYYDCTTGGACGQLKNVTNALGHTTAYDAYDAAGRLLQMTDPNGVKTSYTYDARGRVLTLTVTPPTGTPRVTHYTYDAVGQVTSVTTPDGVKLTYTYDAAHYLRTITDNLGNKIAYTYDLKGNRTATKTHDPQGMLVRSIELAYDTRNRVSEINSGGSLTRQVWDAVGNLLNVTDPNTVAQNGTAATTHQYDPLNRLTQTLDRLNGSTQYSYDTADRVKHITAPNSAATGYQVDDLGNVLQETSPDRGASSYSYDTAGNVASFTDARGITVTYAYDALNRLTLLDYPGTAEDVTYTYDTGINCTFGFGRLCQVQDESGLTRHAYDPYGNITQQTHIELGVTYTTKYTYDAGDRISSITYPSGRQVTYSRDTLDRISGVSTTLNGQITPLTTQRTYRADGALTAQTFGNGLSEQRTYDLQGRLTHQSLGTIHTRSYTYDPNGNLTQRQGTGAAAYAYDALDRLTADTLSGGAGITYTYDKNGNRLTDTQGALTTTYGYATATNRLINVGAQMLTLDASGNLIQEPVGRRDRRYSYNGTGRLSQITAGRKTLAAYTYNHQGQRSHKTLPHRQHVIYHYDLQGNLLSETDETGALIKDYVWADSTPLAQIEPATRRTPETVTYLHTDHLNTPRLATNQSGAIIWTWDGNAFGATPPNEDPDGDRNLTTINLRYPGQYYDQETGFHYNWNRYYDPQTGRYISHDRLSVVPGRVPETMLPMYSTAWWTNDLLLAGLNHPYVYANNNPLRFIDPFGLQAGDGTDSSGDYNRYRICPENPIGGKICEVCIDLACKVSMTVCCTFEQQACNGAAGTDDQKQNECRNKFIECIGKVRKPKLPKGPGDGDI